MALITLLIIIIIIIKKKLMQSIFTDSNFTVTLNFARGVRGTRKSSQGVEVLPHNWSGRVRSLLRFVPVFGRRRPPTVTGSVWLTWEGP